MLYMAKAWWQTCGSASGGSVGSGELVLLAGHGEGEGIIRYVGGNSRLI